MILSDPKYTFFVFAMYKHV